MTPEQVLDKWESLNTKDQYLLDLHKATNAAFAALREVLERETMFTTLETIHTLCKNLDIGWTLEYVGGVYGWELLTDCSNSEQDSNFHANRLGKHANFWNNQNLQLILDAAETWLTRAM